MRNAPRKNTKGGIQNKSNSRDRPQNAQSTANFQYKKAKTSHPSSSACCELEDEIVLINSQAYNQISSKAHERRQDPVHHSTSNIGPFWNVTDIPEVGGSSSVKNLDTDHTSSLVPQNRLRSRNSPPDVSDELPVKATPRQSENPFPSLSPDVSSELEVQGVPTAQFIKSKRKQKSSDRKQLPTTCQKRYERQCGAVNTLNIQAPISSDDELENDYDANLGNRNLSNNQYGVRLLKRNPRRPKTIPTRTPPGNDNQKLGPAEARTGNGTNNGPRFSSRGQRKTNEEEVKLSVEEYNTLKRRLETAERLNVFLESSGSLWKAECERLKIELNKALINSECKSLSKDFAKTPSTSASGNNSCRRNVRLHSMEKDRMLLKKELLDMNVAHLLSIHIYSFFDNCTVFAHYYISEVCEARWFKLNDEMSWAPNEVNSTNEMIRDWRGRCLQKTGFTNMENVPQSELSKIGAPLLHCVKTEGNQTEPHYNVAGAFIPICPFQEAFKGNLFSSTEKHVKNFILSGIVSIMSEYGDIGSNPEERPITMNILKELVGNSKTLPKVFKAKCNEVLSSRKKAAKDYYFNMLGYSSIFAKRGQEVNKVLEDARCRERKEAHAKMWKENSSGLRDTSWWRRATFSDICRSGCDSGWSGETERPGTDELFRNDVARRAFQKFLKYGGTSSSETSISSLIRFDAIMTDAIDSLANNIDAMQTIQVCHTGTDTVPPDVVINRPTIPSRGGTVPQESLRKLKLLLPLAARNLLCFCYKIFRKRCPECSESECVETGVAQGVTIEERLKNNSRVHTICFKMPDTGQYYIALTLYAFKEFLCEWMGNVNDCYILHSRSLNDPFVPFQSEYPLETIYESDEEQGSLRDLQTSVIPTFTNNQEILNSGLISDSDDSDQSD